MLNLHWRCRIGVVNPKAREVYERSQATQKTPDVLLRHRTAGADTLQRPGDAVSGQSQRHAGGLRRIHEYDQRKAGVRGDDRGQPDTVQGQERQAVPDRPDERPRAHPAALRQRGEVLHPDRGADEPCAVHTALLDTAHGADHRRGQLFQQEAGGEGRRRRGQHDVRHGQVQRQGVREVHQRHQI